MIILISNIYIIQKIQAQMRAIEQERIETESDLIKNKEDEHFRERNEKDQEIKDLRDKLSQASLASQVNEYDFLKVEFTKCAQNDFFCVKMR